jgi:hypothetical protein
MPKDREVSDTTRNPESMSEMPGFKPVAIPALRAALIPGRNAPPPVRRAEWPPLRRKDVFQD